METVAALIVLLLSTVFGNISFVKRCPGNKEEWEEKDGILCSNEPTNHYHCLRIQNYSLVEGCLTVVTAMFKEGCPWLDIKENMIKFKRCEDGIPDCPPDTDGWFVSNHVYKYQGCFKRPSDYRQTLSTSDIETTTTFADSPLVPVTKLQDGETSIHNVSSTGNPSLGQITENIFVYAIIGGAGGVILTLMVSVCSLMVVGLMQQRQGQSARPDPIPETVQPNPIPETVQPDPIPDIDMERTSDENHYEDIEDCDVV